MFSHDESLPILKMPLPNVGHDDILLNNAFFHSEVFFPPQWSHIKELYKAFLSQKMVVILSILVELLPLTYSSSLDFSDVLSSFDVWE